MSNSLNTCVSVWSNDWFCLLLSLVCYQGHIYIYIYDYEQLKQLSVGLTQARLNNRLYLLLKFNSCTSLLEVSIIDVISILNFETVRGILRLSDTNLIWAKISTWTCHLVQGGGQGG